MTGVRWFAGFLSVAFVCVASPAVAQDGGDVTGVLVLNGKGYARGKAEVRIFRGGGDKEQEQVDVVLEVCADEPGSAEQRCKLLPDDIPASRVSSFEQHATEVLGWIVMLTLDTDGEGELKPCSASGTTLPAHVTCGPTPTRQSVVFQLTGGGR